MGKKMAADRAHADKALAAESSRFSAALNAQSALEDEHFAKTVSDIAAAKAEADARVKKFTKGFKVSIAHLSAMATEQQKDQELKALMSKNKDENAARMEKIQQEFTASLDAIKKQAAADRKHHENAVAHQT